MDLMLEDRVGLVTGASRGLGQAIAVALLEEGMRLLVAARSNASLEALAVRFPGQVEPVACDMADLDTVVSLPARAVERFGALDVLVNNAGVAPATRFVDQERDAWEHTFTVNVTAPALLCREAGARMRDQGHGSIINVASTTGLRGKAWLAAYSASKGAVLRLTESLAAEWMRDGVRVNAIAPGAFVTEAQQAVLDDPELHQRRIAKIPAGRMGDPGELTGLVLYLASEQASFVSGATFVIDGGEANRL